MARIPLCVAVAVLLSQLSTSAGSSGCAAVASWTGGAGAMRLRGGMSAVDQMAEIRAMRAKQYEDSKKGEDDTAAKQAAAEASFEGAQKVWVMVTDKIKPATIQTKAKPMPLGDARNFYQDSGVTLLRNRQTGAVIELVHASEGWIQFSSREGGTLHTLSTAGDIVASHRWYAEGLLEQIKEKPLHASSIPSAGFSVGPWKGEVVGRRILVSHRDDAKRQLHITEDGFVALNQAWEEALLVKSTGGVERMSLTEGENLLTAL